MGRRGDLLSRLGYYDQSHLINEFRYFTGKSPLLYDIDNQPPLDFMRDRRCIEPTVGEWPIFPIPACLPRLSL